MKSMNALTYYGVSAIKLLMNFKPVHRLIRLFLTNDNSMGQVLRFRRIPLQFTVRGAMDVWSLKETFLDAFYTRFGIPVENGWQVIDIGAGIGDYCIYAAYNKPNVVVYAFEPFLESYHLLVRNLSLNGIKNVRPFHQAIWSCQDQISLDVSSGEPLQIASQTGATTQQNDGLQTVQAISLEDVLRKHDLEKVNLMKLDCEGAEYEILLCASAAVLQKVERIIMEYHDLDEDRDHQRITAYLQEVGFQVTEHENIVHDNLGYLYASRV